MTAALTSPDRRTAPRRQAATSVPTALRASVVVPVYNGARVIMRCLDALAGQTGMLPEDYEIIVVDDGSHDGTPAVVETWMRRNPGVQCRLVQQPNAGPGAARNTGVRYAQADLLLFTDADCAPVAHWLQSLLRAFADPAVAGAKGAYLTRQAGLTPRFVQAEYEERYARMQARPQIDFIDTYSAAYRRAIFEQHGGFDPRFRVSCEDQELSFRLAQAGHRLVFVPAAQVVHLHDATVAEYARRKFVIGIWKALLTRFHPQRMVEDSHTPQTLKLQMLLSAAGMALLPLALLSVVVRSLRWVRWPLLAVAAGFLASALPFLRHVARRDRAVLAIAPLLLVVRALMLGLGYAAGQVRWSRQQPGLPREAPPEQTGRALNS